MNNDKYIDEDEITLKDLILKLQGFWKELLRNWMLIGLIALPFVVWFFYDAYTTPVEYDAELVFMINEDKGGGGGGLASLAGQFGFNVGGGGGGEYNKDKIISLSESGKIINSVILDSLEIEGVNDLIGNHLIRLYELHEKWEKSTNEELKSFLFTTDNLEDLTRTGNTALKSCFALITGTKDFTALSSCSYDEKSGMLTTSSQSISEDLSYGLTNKIFTKLSSFYIKQQIEPQENNYRTIKAKADSLNTLIESKEYELASLKDGNNSVFVRKFKLREARLQRELPAYAAQYAALLQNVESADFMLKTRTPFFQVVDYPFYPLAQIKTSKLKALITGGIAGVFLATFFVIGRKFYRDTMSEV